MRYQPVPDYHMHTPRCNHAIGTVQEYAAAALRLGLSEIGMSDHSPMPGGFDKEWRMPRTDLPDYLREVEQMRDQYASRLTVRIGLEADFHPGTENYVQEMIGAYDWDYVIGSVHYIGEWGFDNEDNLDQWHGRDVEDAYCAYFDLVAQSAETGMFDIIGHPDLIKKFCHRPPPGSARVAAAEEAMLQAVKQAGCALEISSAGLRKPVGEVYPHGRILARAIELEIPFAFGSDAHAPGEVGHAMHTCLAMLEACGASEVVAFRQRKRSTIRIRKVDAA
ncbi:MAG: histidinol-phosphatase HisJ [Mariprofundaceae bacterium]